MSLKRTDIWLMSLATGLIVANIYYCQPLILLIAKEFGKEDSTAASISYFTQGGYALGLLLLVPLGDRFERKKQIIFITILAVCSLVLAALSPNFLVLSIASVLIGFSSIVPQLILPLAATLSDAQERGRVIGMIMGGLLIGILLSRTLSGAIGALFGWRAMFWIAAALCIILLVAIQKRFPRSSPNFKGTYFDLMMSLAEIVKKQPLLREASIINALSFALFGAFWTTMVLYLGGPAFDYQSEQIGLFGLVGATGALAAPVVGRLSDKKDARKTIGYGLLIILLSIILFYFTSSHLVFFILAIVLLDLGHQCVHVSNQTRVYALDPDSRNRLNTVFMTVSFIGVTLGSAFGLLLWRWNQWPGVCVGLAILSVIALVIYGLTINRRTV